MRLHGMEGDHEARKRTDRTGQRELKADSSVTLQEWEVHGMSRSRMRVRLLRLLRLLGLLGARTRGGDDGI